MKFPVPMMKRFSCLNKRRSSSRKN